MKHQDQLLQLIVPEAQYTQVVDFLLAQPETPFFTMLRAEGFGQPHEHLNAVEQVAGAQRKVKFEVELRAEMVEPLLSDLQNALPTLNIFYRVLPIMHHGVLG